jgi:hypothetical protein
MMSSRVDPTPSPKDSEKDGAPTLVLAGTKPHTRSVAKAETDCKKFREKSGDAFPNREGFTVESRGYRDRGEDCRKSQTAIVRLNVSFTFSPIRAAGCRAEALIHLSRFRRD